MSSNDDILNNELKIAASMLAEEIRDEKHPGSVIDEFKSFFAKSRHIHTLKMRCPGFMDEEYEKALGKAMFESR